MQYLIPTYENHTFNTGFLHERTSAVDNIYTKAK